MIRKFILLSFFIMATSLCSSEETDSSKQIEIMNFSGSIEVIYSDGTRFVMKAGDEMVPLETGVVLRILQGNLTLRVGNDIQVYQTGELVRLSENSSGVWEAYVSPGKTSYDAKNTNLTNPRETQAETGRELASADGGVTETGTGEFVDTPVSPSAP